MFRPLSGVRCVRGHVPHRPPPVPLMAAPTAAPHGVHMGEPGPVCRETTHVCKPACGSDDAESAYTLIPAAKKSKTDVY